MSRRPTIGVTTSAHGGWRGFAFNWLALWRAGGRAVRITPGETPDVERLDGLIIGGGDHISAELYGGTPLPTVDYDADRDRLELSMLDYAQSKGLPVLGICRGAQMLNVHRLGTLHADIFEIYTSAPRRRTVLPLRSIEIERDSKLARLLGLSRIRVNAMHRQAIDKVGEKLRIVALDDHHVVQAIESTEKGFVFGVQWHPEWILSSRTQLRLFKALVKASA